MLNLILILPILKGIYFFLLMAQLDHYKLNSPFKYIKTYYFKKPFLLCLLISVFLLFNKFIINIFAYIIIILISLINSHYVIKLKITKRIIRLFIVVLLLSSIPFVYSFHISSFILTILLLPFIFFISLLITYPYEKLIYTYYKAKATRKLKKINPFIIEITGSYGKTSIKNMLHAIYSPYYLTCSTPKSYNTPMGISKTILKDLENLTEIFIVEAGATTKGDIKEITKMVNPNLGIITYVGYQHMESFKTIDNVLKTKWELSDTLDNGSTLILNYGCDILDGLSNPNILNSVGVNKYGTYMYAKNIKHNDIYTEFDIYSYNKKLIHVKTKLLGNHNINNIVMCYAVVKSINGLFNITNEQFKTQILSLTNPIHRQSLNEFKIHNTTFRILDDSYNANVDGFISACNTLKHLEGIKCIITPGLVETGKYTNELIERITPSLKDLDEVILINNTFTNNLKNHLNKLNISYKLFNSLKDAFNYIKSKYYDFNKDYVNILLENDLPDNYLLR